MIPNASQPAGAAAPLRQPHEEDKRDASGQASGGSGRRGIPRPPAGNPVPRLGERGLEVTPSAGSRAQPEQSFWGEEEPSDDTPRLTSATQTTRSAAPSSAEAFFNLREAPASRNGRNLLGKVRGAIARTMNKEEALAARQAAAVRGLLNVLEQRGEKTLSVAIQQVEDAFNDEQAMVRFTSEVAQRVNTAKMTASELEDLRKHAVSAAPPHAAPYLRVVRDAADRALCELNPALSPLLQDSLLQALASVRNKAEDVAQMHFAYAFDQATAFLAATPGATPYAILLDSLAYVLQRLGPDVDRDEALTLLFAALPSQHLMGIAAEQPVSLGAPGGNPRLGLLDVARATILARRDSASEALNDKLECIRVTSEPATLVEQLIDAAKSFDAAKFYGGQPLGCGPEVAEQVRNLCQPAYLATLERITFKSLDTALTKLGLGHETAAEVKRREGDRRTARMEPVHAVVNALQQSGCATSLVPALQSVRSALERWQLSRASQSQFAPEIAKLIQSLPPADQTALSAAVTAGGSDLRVLAAAMLELSKYSIVKEQDAALADELANVALALMSSGVRVERSAPPKLNELPARVCVALEVFGVQIDREGNVRMHDRGSEPAGPGLDPADIDYMIDGRIVGTSQLASGVGALAPSPETKYALSRIATYDAAWERAERARAVPNLAQMPDGTTSELQREHTTLIDMRSNGQGGVDVQFKLIVRPEIAEVTNPETGEPREVELLPGAVFMYQAAVDARGEVTMSPVESLELFAAGKTYQLPTHARQITERGADPRLVADFRAFLESEFSSENFVFITALNHFFTNPTAQGAQALWLTYIKPGVPDQVNISGVLAGATGEAVEAALVPGAGPEAMQEVHRQFSTVHAEVTNLVHNDSFARFLKKIQVLDAEAVRSRRAPQVARPAPADGVLIQESEFPDLAGNVRQRLKFLTEPLYPADKLSRSVGLMETMAPRELQKWRREIPPREEAYFRRLQTHVDAQVRALNRLQLASLRYNLEVTLEPSMRNDRHVQLFIQAAAKAVAGKPESRVPMESILLAASIVKVDFGLLSSWVSERKVTRFEAEAALHRVTSDSLRKIADDPLVRKELGRMAGTILSKREANLKAAAEDLSRAAAFVAQKIVSARSLNADRARDIIRLHTNQLSAYERHSELAGNDRVRMREEETAQKSREDLASTITHYLGQLNTSGMTPTEPEALRDAFKALGVEAVVLSPTGDQPGERAPEAVAEVASAAAPWDDGAPARSRR